MKTTINKILGNIQFQKEFAGSQEKFTILDDLTELIKMYLDDEKNEIINVYDEGVLEGKMDKERPLNGQEYFKITYKDNGTR